MSHGTSRAQARDGLRARWLRGVVLAVVAAGSVAPALSQVESKPPERELTADRFAYGMKVLTPADAAAYRVPLPASVYQKVVRADLGDLRVFNERDEEVPYRIERPHSESSVQAPELPLAVFPLRGDPREALDSVRVTIESSGTRVNVIAPTGNPAARREASVVTPAVSYVLDGRALRVPIEALRVSWPEGAADFAGHLRVEASDDLGWWRPVVVAAPIANLRAGDARIVENRVALGAASSRFWRLSWAGAVAPFEITAVFAQPARGRVERERASLTAAATSVAGRRGEFEFDLGAQVPVDRVNLELPEPNSIVEVELLSRALRGAPWRSAARGGFYRLKGAQSSTAAAGGPEQALPEITNSALAIEPNTDRYWLARVDMRAGGLGRGSPTLRAGWLPHEVVFLARGAGPFTLAYGSGTVRGAAFSSAIPDGVAVSGARLADPRPLGGEGRRSAEEPVEAFWSKPVVLWSVLVLGVALLAFMAYRLARELK